MGLGEIRIEHPKEEHYRFLGYFEPAETVFTLVYPFAKGVAPPYRLACAQAQVRKMEIEHDQRRLRLWGGFTIH
jgi:hypothetical protein